MGCPKPSGDMTIRQNGSNCTAVWWEPFVTAAVRLICTDQARWAIRIQTLEGKNRLPT
jgi:hypothetical protein